MKHHIRKDCVKGTTCAPTQSYTKKSYSTRMLVQYHLPSNAKIQKDITLQMSVQAITCSPTSKSPKIVIVTKLLYRPGPRVADHPTRLPIRDPGPRIRVKRCNRTLGFLSSQRFWKRPLRSTLFLSVSIGWPFYALVSNGLLTDH